MTEQVEVHETSTSWVRAASAELDAGTELRLKVRVACPSKCNLQGGQVTIAGEEGAVVKEMELTCFDAAANETDEWVVQAPTKPGAYTWTAVFSAQENKGILHQASSAPFSFIVKPHTTSMMVWDVPSPIAVKARFKFKVGVRCSAQCKLTGTEFEIYDHQGAKIGTGILGDVPWPSTSLYWAEVESQAPVTVGVYNWTVKFPKPELELAHEGSSDTFALGTATPPEHVVTVKVTDKTTQAPLKDAFVALHSQGTPYRNRTDDAGVASVNVPKGKYKLYVVMPDYVDWETTAEIAGDMTVQAELVFAPDDYG